MATRQARLETPKGLNKSQDVNVLLNERGSTHGDFTVNSKIVQDTKRLWRASPNWDRLAPHQAEALDMVAHKVGRILSGDPDFFDHWKDIAGYAVLVEQRCPRADGGSR